MSLVLLLKFFLMMSSTPSLASTLRKLRDLIEYLLSFLKTVPPCWHPALSNSFASACQHPSFRPSLPTKTDLSNPSNYHPRILLSSLFKAFESIHNWKIQKYFSSSDLSDRQFRKWGSTDDLLCLLTDFSSSFLSRFGETLSVSLDISKAFDRVWHKSLFSKLTSFGFYTSFCLFISSFLSGRTISAVVHGHCSIPKPINNGVPQGFVLPLILFLLFINIFFP